MDRRKRMLQDVMSTLEEEVEKGNVNEGAHLRLCKKLKRAHDAASGAKRKHVEALFHEMFVDDPYLAEMIPLTYRHYMIDPHFLRMLITKKRKFSSDRKIPDRWWADLMQGVLPEWMFQMQQPEMVSGCRGVIGLILETKRHTMEPLEKHLNKHNCVPSKLFPATTNPDDDVEAEGSEVWTVLRTDSRFLRWLLKEEHGYSPEEVMQLRKYALSYSNLKSFRDEMFLRAMGLKNGHDAMHLALNMAIGKDFAESLALVQASPRNADQTES